jgi:hypothetical protein
MTKQAIFSNSAPTPSPYPSPPLLHPSPLTSSPPPPLLPPPPPPLFTLLLPPLHPPFSSSPPPPPHFTSLSPPHPPSHSIPPPSPSLCLIHSPPPLFPLSHIHFSPVLGMDQDWEWGGNEPELQGLLRMDRNRRNRPGIHKEWWGSVKLCTCPQPHGPLLMGWLMGGTTGESGGWMTNDRDWNNEQQQMTVNDRR